MIETGDLELRSPPNFLDTLYRWETGDMAAHAHFNYVQYPHVHTLEIVGDRGYLQSDFMKPEILVGWNDRVERISLTLDFDDGYRVEWDHFLQADHEETEPENSAGSAILSTLLM